MIRWRNNRTLFSERFQKSYKERYNICEQEYIAGLRLNHPDFLPSNDSCPLSAPILVVDMFCDVTPLGYVKSSMPAMSSDLEKFTTK